MIEPRISRLWAIPVLACLGLTCKDNTVDGFLPFGVYGRLVYNVGLYAPTAEFYIYHGGDAVTDAIITVEADTIPLVNASRGYYSKEMAFATGDTLEYSVSSSFGTSAGSVVIPDTAEIVSPMAGDTLRFGFGFDVDWQRAPWADGYFVYLDNQEGLVAAVTETSFDTSATLSGADMINSGIDNIRVEVLRGQFYRGQTPDDRILPEGVVGAAGNYREIYISLSK